MKNQFADYETSKMLKKLGSNQENTSAYYLRGEFNFSSINNKSFCEPLDDIVSAYLWQQVKQYLFEKHNIYFYITEFLGDWIVHILQSSNGSGGQYINIMELRSNKYDFKNPIEAEIEAIKKSVKHLTTFITTSKVHKPNEVS